MEHYNSSWKRIKIKTKNMQGNRNNNLVLIDSHGLSFKRMSNHLILIHWQWFILDIFSWKLIWATDTGKVMYLCNPGSYWELDCMPEWKRSCTAGQVPSINMDWVWWKFFKSRCYSSVHPQHSLQMMLHHLASPYFFLFPSISPSMIDSLADYFQHYQPG